MKTCFIIIRAKHICHRKFQFLFAPVKTFGYHKNRRVPRAEYRPLVRFLNICLIKGKQIVFNTLIYIFPNNRFILYVFKVVISVPVCMVCPIP